MVERVRVIGTESYKTDLDTYEHLYIFQDECKREFAINRKDLLDQNTFFNPYTGEEIDFYIDKETSLGLDDVS